MSAGAGGCLGHGRYPNSTLQQGLGSLCHRAASGAAKWGRGEPPGPGRGLRVPREGGTLSLARTGGAGSCRDAEPPGGTAGAGLGVPAGGGDGRAGDTARLVLALPREWLPGAKMEAVSRAGQEISLAALKQHDPYITSIADVTGQVALYSFSPKANEWVSPGERAQLSARPGRGGGGGAAPSGAFAGAGCGGAGAAVAGALGPAAAWRGASAGAALGQGAVWGSGPFPRGGVGPKGAGPGGAASGAEPGPGPGPEATATCAGNPRPGSRGERGFLCSWWPLLG